MSLREGKHENLSSLLSGTKSVASKDASVENVYMIGCYVGSKTVLAARKHFGKKPNIWGMGGKNSPAVAFHYERETKEGAVGLRADSRIRSQDRGRRDARSARREEGEYIDVFNRRATQQVGMDRRSNPEVIFELALSKHGFAAKTDFVHKRLKTISELIKNKVLYIRLKTGISKFEKFKPNPNNPIDGM